MMRISSKRHTKSDAGKLVESTGKALRLQRPTLLSLYLVVLAALYLAYTYGLDWLPLV